MRRSLLPLACVAVLVACDGGSAPGRGTVEVGALPGSLPGGGTGSSSDAAVVPSTAPVDAETTMAPIADVVLAEELADLVGGEVGTAPATDVVTDGTGRLRMALPEAWGDRRVGPARSPGGAEAPSIVAAGDRTAFLDGYDEPGLTAVVVDAAPAAALTAYAFDDCTSAGRRPFAHGAWRGSYEAWRDCAGSGSSIVTVAVRHPDADGTVLVLTQVAAPSDLAALDEALATLRLRDA